MKRIFKKIILLVFSALLKQPLIKKVAVKLMDNKAGKVLYLWYKKQSQIKLEEKVFLSPRGFLTYKKIKVALKQGEIEK